MANRPRSRNARPISAAAAADLAQQRADRKRESQQRKEQFLIFIKALMKDLHQMDPAMHARAKAIIQDCTEKKKRRVPGFDFETTMRTRLLEAVGESNWRRVERDLHRRRNERKEQKTHRRVPSTDSSSNTSTASLSLTSDEPERESRQQTTTERSPSVTLSLNDLSLNDGSVEVEAIESERDRKERREAEAKVDAFVKKIESSRPPAAVVVPEDPRYIYI